MINHYLSLRQFDMAFDEKANKREGYSFDTGAYHIIVATPHIVFVSDEDNEQYYDTNDDIKPLDTDAENLIPITKDQYSHLAVIEKSVNALFNIALLGNEKADCLVSGEEIDDISGEASPMYRRLYTAYGKECKAIIDKFRQASSDESSDES